MRKHFSSRPPNYMIIVSSLGQTPNKSSYVIFEPSLTGVSTDQSYYMSHPLMRSVLTGCIAWLITNYDKKKLVKKIESILIAFVSKYYKVFQNYSTLNRRVCVTNRPRENVKKFLCNRKSDRLLIHVCLLYRKLLKDL